MTSKHFAHALEFIRAEFTKPEVSREAVVALGALYLIGCDSYDRDSLDGQTELLMRAADLADDLCAQADQLHGTAGALN